MINFQMNFIMYVTIIAELLRGRRPREWSPIVILKGVLVIFYGHGKRNGSRARAPYIHPYRQVSKTAEHARAVPAINVTKWRTTNKVLPRSFASRQSARGELLVKNVGSVKRTTLLVCLGVSSEKSVVIIHMIIPFILFLLVKMFATTRKRSGLSFSCWIRSAVAG